MYIREHRDRRELVPGAFADYTYQNSSNLTIVAGLRTDYHNLYGWQATPRLYINMMRPRTRYCAWPPAGDFAWPTPLPITLRCWPAPASSSSAIICGPSGPGISAAAPRSILRCWAGRPRRCSTTYHTEFDNQVVADMYSAARYVLIDNLPPGGRSYARNLQAELQVEPLKGLQVKGAYKYLDVRTSYDGVLLLKPLTPAHRAFVNLGYASAFDK